VMGGGALPSPPGRGRGPSASPARPLVAEAGTERAPRVAAGALLALTLQPARRGRWRAPVLGPGGHPRGTHAVRRASAGHPEPSLPRAGCWGSSPVPLRSRDLLSSLDAPAAARGRGLRRSTGGRQRRVASVPSFPPLLPLFVYVFIYLFLQYWDLNSGLHLEPLHQPPFL
jgi:hypothetical protein